jgi:hypothetical protein
VVGRRAAREVSLMIDGDVNREGDARHLSIGSVD